MQEGRAAEEVARNLQRDGRLAERVRVPRIEWDLTTRRVLSMEFLEGVKINDAEALLVGEADTVAALTPMPMRTCAYLDDSFAASFGLAGVTKASTMVPRTSCAS